MANVQLEKGFTRIANELLEATQNYKFTLNQYKIIQAVWRYTYGYDRKEHIFSLSFLEKTTNLTRTRISESLKGLIEKKVLLEIQKGGGRRSKVLSFNKNYDDWEIEKYANSSLQNDTTRGQRNDTTRGLQDDTKYKELKRKSLKKKNNLDLRIQGNVFLNIYNQHFFNKFGKQHMKVTEIKHDLILNELESIDEILTDSEKFEDIVFYHFANLPKGNDGNILAFLPAFKRYFKEIILGG
ncbi:replication protein [Neobacillus sp. PS3-40]|uniref:replication protein n=1 Tax=Neobacillus sp. PS3-40 TaxID=3070679 RepID=UPI0027E0BBA2|nr:replication protein [Neobacillus sp. PS3-40]WML42700.1 replication protein [Neobacillus sp. PS3-40]